MRCKTCNYALWNLPGRTCPECGSAFKPSDFEFVPSAVKFCCRECMQPYYGTTWQGHLMPVSFTCVSCGSPVHMDETVVLPTEGVDEERTVQGTNPWLDRRRGAFGRFFAGIGHAMVRPSEMARGTPRDASLGAAAGFALLVNLAAYTVCLGPQVLLMLMGGPAAVGSAAVMILVLVAMVTLGLWIWGLAAHALLKITGPTAGGFRQTYLALYYSAGANIFSAIPCMGFLFGWIWWVVSAAMMLREFQRIGGGRAALAALLPPLVVVGLAVGGYMWFVSTMMSRAMAAARAAQTAQTAPWVAPGGVSVEGGSGSGTQSAAVVGVRVLSGVQAWAAANQGAMPEHPAELMAYRYVPLDGWFVAGSGSSDTTALVGGQRLRDLDLLPPGERLTAFRRAMDMEARVEGEAGAASGWRRLGDVLLAEMGDVTLDRAVLAGLWVVVVSPDPDAGRGTAQAFTAIGVGGVVREVSPDGAAAALEEQNAARAGVGLGALGDPRGVGHTPVPGG